MKFSYLAVAFGALIALSTGCTSSTEPTEPRVTPPAEESPPPAPAFPPLSRAGEIYEAAESLYELFSAYHGSNLASRYVLYEDNTFGLQFSSLRFGFFQYAGSYSRVDSLINFAFNDSNTAGLWEATGTLRGDSLTVRYNLVMGMADFLDGVYVRSLGTR